MSYTVAIQGKEVVAMTPRLAVVVVNPERDDLLDELSKLAGEIHQLRNAVDFINANEDQLAFDRACIRLDASEKEYFLVFNELRIIEGHEPLEGQKFTCSSHPYDSVLF